MQENTWYERKRILGYQSVAIFAGKCKTFGKVPY
jgi:hypothetical protein